jgi:hypothetical protein
VARYVPGVTRCALGGEVLAQPARLLDLAHNDARPGEYLGLACQYHNRSRHAESPFSSRGNNVTIDSSRSAATNGANERDDRRRARVEQRERERRRRVITTDPEGRDG